MERKRKSFGTNLRDDEESTIDRNGLELPYPMLLEASGTGA